MGDVALANRADRVIPTEPDPSLKYRHRVRPATSVREAWRSRAVARSLAERDLRARYKQTALGVAWGLLTPLALMVVFTLVFDRIARFDTGDVPYPLFSYLGIIPWTLFSASVGIGGMSLLSNAPIINKVFCPREVFPVSSVLVAATDMVVAMIPLAILFLVEGRYPSLTAYWIPVLIVVLFAFTIAVTFAVSATVVYVRDLRHVLPLALQLGLLATPVAYGLDLVPEDMRLIYVILNPLAIVIDGLRSCVLFGEAPQLNLLLAGSISAFAMLSFGYFVFKRMEVGFADLA